MRNNREAALLQNSYAAAPTGDANPANVSSFIWIEKPAFEGGMYLPFRTVGGSMKW